MDDLTPRVGFRLVLAALALGFAAGCGPAPIGNVTVLVDTGLKKPRSIAVDPAASKLYWTDEDAGTIMRSDLDGKNVQVWKSGLSHPTGLLLTGGEIYWAELDQANNNDVYGAIFRASESGSGVELVASGIDSPSSIALDTSAHMLYWVDDGVVDAHAGVRGDSISGVPIDGGAAPLLVGVQARDVWVQAHTKLLYTSNDSAPKALRSRDLGTDAEDNLAEGASVYDSVTTDPTTGTLFWGEGVIGTHARIVSHTASGAEHVLLRGSLIQEPRDLAYDPDDHMLYGIDGDVTGPSIFRIPVN